jgi:sporulation protein YlmC with PRC-barrel domain
MADYRPDESYDRGRDRNRDEGARYREFDGDENGGRRGGGGIFGIGGSRERSREDEHRGPRARDHDEDRGRPRWNRDNDRGFGPDDHRGGLPTDETGHLIASNKVEGTAVYSRDGERLGSIYNFMVDKFSGKVEYAVMAYGGMLGLGERYYPLPWRTLSYDTRAGGYRIDMSRNDLKSAPSFDRDTEPRFDRHYGSRVHDFYGLNY